MGWSCRGPQPHLPKSPPAAVTVSSTVAAHAKVKEWRGLHRRNSTFRFVGLCLSVGSSKKRIRKESYKAAGIARRIERSTGPFARGCPDAANQRWEHRCARRRALRKGNPTETARADKIQRNRVGLCGQHPSQLGRCTGSTPITAGKQIEHALDRRPRARHLSHFCCAMDKRVVRQVKTREKGRSRCSRLPREPPSRGSSIFATAGSTRKSSAALRKTEMLKENQDHAMGSSYRADLSIISVEAEDLFEWSI